MDPTTSTKSLSVIIFVIKKKKGAIRYLKDCSLHPLHFPQSRLTNSTNKHCNINPILTHNHHWFYKHVCIRHKFSFFLGLEGFEFNKSLHSAQGFNLTTRPSLKSPCEKKLICIWFSCENNVSLFLKLNNFQRWREELVVFFF